MKTTTSFAKLNGKVVHGEAHIQPGVNNWIGICITGDEQFIKKLGSQDSVIVEYKGLFNCGEKYTNGKGKAKVLHITRDSPSNKLIINIEGIEEPELEKKLEKKLKFSYNKNLPVDLKSLKKR